MSPRSTALVLGLAAWGCTATAQAAAPDACITRTELHGVIAYLAPTAIHNLTARCTSQLAAGNFFDTQAPALEARMAAGQDAAWPDARKGLAKFAGKDGKALATLNIGDQTVCRIADPIIAKKLSFEKVKASDCRDAGEIGAAIAKLPTDDAIDLIIAVAHVAMRGDKDLTVCD